MQRAVICILNRAGQAERVVERLRAAGFPSDQISVLFPDKLGSRDLGHQRSTKAPDGAAAGASAGGLLGGGLGWLVGIGSLSIPGLGPFVAAGPIMAALSGAAVGAAAGGIAGGLIGLGVPEYEAKQYEGKIKGGNILISVHTDDSDESRHVKEIFEKEGAEDIRCVGEAKPA
jgi:hypothetical protein